MISQSHSEMIKLVTFRLERQSVAIDVAYVHDVIKLGPLSPVPLAPNAVAGVMNLRGRVVTAIDMRARLGLPPRDAECTPMCIVIEHDDQPYGLIVDTVGDVIDIASDQIEGNPITLNARWQQVSGGIVKLDELLVIAKVAAIMDDEMAVAA